MRALTPILVGAICVAAIGAGAAAVTAPPLVARLDHAARGALDGAGGASVRASFADRYGWLTRHPTLSGGDRLDDALRIRAAAAVAVIPGVGGVSWAPRPRRAGAEPAAQQCQHTIEAILRTRSIRFAQGSAAIDPDSQELLDEVAAALRPCTVLQAGETGSVIAISGHTDSGGEPAINLGLSQARADAVQLALGKRGIPLSGLRARGMGSRMPLPGLDPADPANRRIEFAVIAPMVLVPTPVDTPGAG